MNMIQYVAIAMMVVLVSIGAVFAHDSYVHYDDKKGSGSFHERFQNVYVLDEAQEGEELAETYVDLVGVQGYDNPLELEEKTNVELHNRDTTTKYVYCEGLKVEKIIEPSESFFVVAEPGSYYFDVIELE